MAGRVGARRGTRLTFYPQPGQRSLTEVREIAKAYNLHYHMQ